MCSEYYFQIRRKSYEFATSDDRARTSREVNENAAGAAADGGDGAGSGDGDGGGAVALLTDYEIVENEQEYDVEYNEVVRGPLRQDAVRRPLGVPARACAGGTAKLRVSLSAEKIALKSQTPAKINKSIRPSEQRQPPKQQKRGSVPFAFSIVPISLAAAQRQQRALAAGRCGDDEIKRFPEIVLTSFSGGGSGGGGNGGGNGGGGVANELSTSGNRRRAAAKVTFQTSSAPPSPPPPLQQLTKTAQQPPQHQRRRPSKAAVVAAAPAPNSLRPTLIDDFKNLNITDVDADADADDDVDAQRAEGEITDKLAEMAEDSSELFSQPGSSTSPESIMDNILSAASSVSVRSSSLSSNGAAAPRPLHVYESSAAVLAAARCERAVAGSACASRAAAAALTKAATKQPAANRSLNSKAGERTALTSPPPPPPPYPPSLWHTTATRPISSNSSTVPQAMSPMATGAHSNEMRTLHPPPPPEAFEASSNRSRSSSPSPSIVICLTPEPVEPQIPEELKCRICAELFRDPRTLNCLHSFCFQCIVAENFKQDQSIPFWSQPAAAGANGGSGGEENNWTGTAKAGVNGRSPSPDASVRSASDTPTLATTTTTATTSPLRRQGSSFSFRRKKSLERILLKGKSDGRGSADSSSLSTRLAVAPSTADDRLRAIICKICHFQTDLAVGGIRQLAQNFVLLRKIEEFKATGGDEVLSKVWCSLCFEETNATYHCISCTLNLCTLCKEAHERQRSTANHKIMNITELRRAKKHQQNMLDDNTKFTLKCGMHPGFEMKAFCTNCLEIACADCLVLLHKGHKHEPIARAIGPYAKMLRESVEQTRPLCNYAEHSIERLNEIVKGINRKCDAIQADVQTFINQYFEALEVHRRTLLQQIGRARDSKVEMILEQQLDLEKRHNEAVEAVRFSQELAELASDVEVLSFVNILLKRFEYCQQFKTPVDPKISDSLHFLPDIRAPSTKTQNDIPLYGIITMQTVEPSLCTLQTEGISHLRLHKRIELALQSRDSDGAALCHGGLHIKAQLKYKESNSKCLPVEVADHRDGTYSVSFTPDSQGTILLTITINERPIKGGPFTFFARTVRPHSGIFHCCAFCSSKGSKLVSCSCDGRMPGYKGCGHGHAGHPGRRHWSCCGNVLENSECNVANKLLNP